jgi:hypothetical protein
MRGEFNCADVDNGRVKSDASLDGEGRIEGVPPGTRHWEGSPLGPTSQQSMPMPEGGLLNVLPEQYTQQRINRVSDVRADESDPGVQLKHLISRQAEAAAQLRGTMPVFFAGDGFPCEAIVKRRKWSRQLEEQWASVVGACMDLGYLAKGDALITTRLVLGMILSAAQHCPPAEQLSAEHITHGVLTLLGLDPGKG